MAEVEVRGTGQVERMADRAGLQVSYTERAKDRTGAVAALTRRIGAVESALDRDGVHVRDRRLFVHDVWAAKRRTGAQADQSYQLRITDLTVLNDVVADLIAAEPASLRGPSWELADSDDAIRQAQREAVTDGQRRAEGYAEALGRQLGQLLRITDNGGMNHQPVRFAAQAARLSGHAPRPDIEELSLEPQLVTVAADCTMAWEIA